MSVAFYRNLFLEAIRLRNHIVATDYHIARHGFDSIIGMLTPETLNTSGNHSMFYNRYRLRQVRQVTASHAAIGEGILLPHDDLRVS